MDRGLSPKLYKVKTKPLMKEALVMLDVCGINPNNPSFRSKIKAIMIISLLFFLNIELLLQLCLNWKGWDSVETFTVYSALMQWTYKLVLTFINRKKFFLLIQHFEHFWSWEGLDETFQNELKHIAASALKALKLFFATDLICIAAFAAQPLFGNEGALPMDSYHPTDRKSEYYFLMFILQIFGAVTGCFCLLAFDSLFTSCIVHVICEMKIIKRYLSVIKFNTNDDEKNLMEVKRLVHHHGVVLKCVKYMDEVYTSVLLNQFGSSLACMCAPLLGIVAMGFPPDVEQLTKYISFIACVLCQLLIYCLIGTVLMEETESIAEAVYETDWWSKTQPKLRRTYVLVIQRAQKREMLKAGGVFPLNLESFTVIVKFGLSFFTVAQGVYSRSVQN